VSSAPITQADARREDLAPSPIHPPHVLAGEPFARSLTTVVLRAGDVGHFPTGATTEWFVPEYVRKLAFHRAVPPRGRVERVARRIARRLVRR
jgi:hypothetical protein